MAIIIPFKKYSKASFNKDKTKEEVILNDDELNGVVIVTVFVLGMLLGCLLKR